MTTDLKLKDAPWKKSYMTNLDNILKSSDSICQQMSVIVKAMVFPVVMQRCESWTIKKAEHQRTMLSNCGAGGDS